jgi:hypothetical protein
MEIRLLNKNYKGIFISINKNSIYCYFHFPNITKRIYFSNNKIQYDSYSTIGFNKHLKISKKFGV